MVCIHFGNKKCGSKMQKIRVSRFHTDRCGILSRNGNFGCPNSSLDGLSKDGDEACCQLLVSLVNFV